MISYSICFHPEAKHDLKNFNYSVQLLILKHIKKLSVSPELGDALGNKYGLNLTGLCKMYVNTKQVRIVYQIFESKVEVLLIGLGKRELNIIYEIVKNRSEKISHFLNLHFDENYINSDISFRSCINNYF